MYSDLKSTESLFKLNNKSGIFLKVKSKDSIIHKCNSLALKTIYVILLRRHLMRIHIKFLNTLFKFNFNIFYKIKTIWLLICCLNSLNSVI
jgi:hypothetical protein